MNKALQRTGWVLQGDAEGGRQGHTPWNLKEEVELDLVFLTDGNPSAVLGFERRQIAVPLPGMDFGLKVLETAIGGLTTVQKNTLEDTLPDGDDIGVLMAWHDAGTLFHQDVTKIEFTLRQRAAPITTVFTPEGFRRIRERIKGPQTNIRTIEGRLFMADFKGYGTRCRVHPSAGDPVLCLFDEEQKDEVLDDILHYVRIVGEAKEEYLSGRIASIKIYDIERLEGRDDEAVDLLPQGTPIMSGATIVLDTNVVSYLMKGGPLAAAYAPHVQGRLTAIAFITVGELYFGAEKNNWGEQKRRERETTLRNFVIIPYDHEIARWDGLSRIDNDVDIPLHPTTHGLPPVPFGTACPW